MPTENQPGHHPAQEQDKPDPDAFAARLGVVEEAEAADGAASSEADAAASRGAAVRVGTVVAGILFLLGGLLFLRRRRTS